MSNKHCRSSEINRRRHRREKRIKVRIKEAKRLAKKERATK